MSQLELALKKARSASRASEHPAAARLAEPPAPNTPFISPWEFGESGLQHDAPAESSRAPMPAGPSVAVPGAGTPFATPLHAADRAPQFHGFNPAYRAKLAMGEGSSQEIREQFRRVAAALYRVREQRPVKVVMIISAVPGEGKTLTAVNLALTLSESYKSRVLLVDADLRRPSVHLVFDLPNTAGLKERLVAEVDELRPIVVSPHLAVLTAGIAAVDPMSALVSERMRAVLAAGAAEADWVVLDTPPVELLPDAKLLSSLADVAILVVHAGSTRCQLSQRAIEAIGRERIVGVVLNQVTEDAGHRHYDAYYGETPRT